MQQRRPPRFDVMHQEPLSLFLLEEGKRRGMMLREIADSANVSKRTLERLKLHPDADRKTVGFNMTTFHKLAASMGGRLALIMDDGRIIDPLRDQK